MTELYVMDPEVVQFTLRDLNRFVRQFRDPRIPLEELTLCKSISGEWRKFAKGAGEPTAEVTFKLGQRAFPHGTPAHRPGVYAIFCCRNGGNQRPCFHVGMSASSLKTRLGTRLGKDVRNNYAGTFRQLRRCPRLWVCTAVMSGRQNNAANRKKLRLLEACLTVHLRVWPYDR